MFQLKRICACVAAAQIALLTAVQAATPIARSAEEERACAGMVNESIRRKELMRELGAYIGDTLPDELEKRAKKHFELVAKLKAECDQFRARAEPTK